MDVSGSGLHGRCKWIRAPWEAPAHAFTWLMFMGGASACLHVAHVLVLEDVHGNVEVFWKDYIVVNHHTVLHMPTLVQGCLVDTQRLVPLAAIRIIHMHPFWNLQFSLQCPNFLGGIGDPALIEWVLMVRVMADVDVVGREDLQGRLEAGFQGSEIAVMCYQEADLVLPDVCQAPLLESIVMELHPWRVWPLHEEDCGTEEHYFEDHYCKVHVGPVVAHQGKQRALETTAIPDGGPISRVPLPISSEGTVVSADANVPASDICGGEVIVPFEGPILALLQPPA